MLFFNYMESAVEMVFATTTYNLYVNVKIIFARIEIESSLALYLSLLFI